LVDRQGNSPYLDAGGSAPPGIPPDPASQKSIAMGSKAAIQLICDDVSIRCIEVIGSNGAKGSNESKGATRRFSFACARQSCLRLPHPIQILNHPAPSVRCLNQVEWMFIKSLVGTCKP